MLAAGGDYRAVKISEPGPTSPPTVHIDHDQSAFPVALRYCACRCTDLGRAKRAGDLLDGLNIPFLVQARMNGYETLETWASSAVATGRALVFECKRLLEWMPFFNIS
jgi:hypothetical protein